VFNNGDITAAVVTVNDISKCIAVTTRRLKTERKERLIPINNSLPSFSVRSKPFFAYSTEVFKSPKTFKKKAMS